MNLDGESLSDEDIHAVLRKGTVSRIFAPVLCGSATKNIGIDLIQDFIVSCMPSPLDRGAWVVTDTDGENEMECQPDPEGPFSAFVFKTITDPFAGRLSIFRVVSGSLGTDGIFFNVNKNAKERFNLLLRLAGKEQIPAKQAGPGAIVAVAKLKETATGDSLCAEERKIKFRCAEPLPSLISFAV